MNQKDRMLAGLPYKAWLDGLSEEQMDNKKKIYEYNFCRPDESEKMDELIRSILGRAGMHVHIEAPFHRDYGKNIEVGDNVWLGGNVVVNPGVQIGNNIVIG